MFHFCISTAMAILLQSGKYLDTDRVFAFLTVTNQGAVHSFMIVHACNSLIHLTLDNKWVVKVTITGTVTVR